MQICGRIWSNRNSPPVLMEMQTGSPSLEDSVGSLKYEIYPKMVNKIIPDRKVLLRYIESQKK